MTCDFYKLPWYKTIDWTPVLVFSLICTFVVQSTIDLHEMYGMYPPESIWYFTDWWLFISITAVVGYPLSKLINDEISDLYDN